MDEHRTTPQVGDPAPDLELPRLDGGVTALRDLQGRPVLVSFLRHAG
jgi:peroxiredoxin